MLSVIVPTYNEAGRIEELLSELRAQNPTCDLIVIDGSSTDATVALAQPYAYVVVTQPNRGRQLNLGARAARGDQLLFLHADVRLPPAALAAVQRALSDSEVAGGTFRLEFAGADLASRVFSFVDRWRRWFGIFYGDSGIFVRRDVFERLGGFREWPVLEDYDFCRRLVRTKKTVCLPERLLVSSRRWQGNLLRTLAQWFFIHSLYFLRVSPAWLARWYPPVRGCAAPAELKAGRGRRD